MNLQFVLSRTVYAARQKMGYTQLQAAEAINISPRMYQRIESGRALPGLLTFLQLQKALHIDLEPLLQAVE